MDQQAKSVDVLIVGGGVNGAGVARDAAGRGLSVMLCEQGDLAGATSSASTKLFHGGLRYLEHYAFGLVRKALIEREVLLRNMPHISHPMRFILPISPGMRPAWLVRMGLFIYDHLGGRKLLPPTRLLDLTKDIAGGPLKSEFRKAFEYSDGWVDDARLVVLNARDAADRGAVIKTRHRVEAARREGGFWIVSVRDVANDILVEVSARILVNASGPWVNLLTHDVLQQPVTDPVRLVRGSHIVVPQLFTHKRAYFFQNADGRIAFAIPYEENFTLIGTTDKDHEGSPGAARCTDAEAAYLCDIASGYFKKPISPDQIVWSFAGVRPLDDATDGVAANASRDYHIQVSHEGRRAALINIYGGKITTFRKLSEEVVAEMAPYVELSGLPWTDHAPLPGGDFPFDGRADLVAKLTVDYPFLTQRQARRMAAAYGTICWRMLGQATCVADLGESFGAGLTELEVTWLCETEWAMTSEDILWRRTKCGLLMSEAEVSRLTQWLEERRT